LTGTFPLHHPLRATTTPLWYECLALTPLAIIDNPLFIASVPPVSGVLRLVSSMSHDPKPKTQNPTLSPHHPLSIPQIQFPLSKTRPVTTESITNRSIAHGHIPHCHIAALPHCRIAALPHCHIATLPHCRIATLPHCRIAALPHCHIATLPHCRTAVLPYCRIAVLPHHRIAHPSVTHYFAD
jgi:hypothetical protein